MELVLPEITQPSAKRTQSLNGGCDQSVTRLLSTNKPVEVPTMPRKHSHYVCRTILGVEQGKIGRSHTSHDHVVWHWQWPSVTMCYYLLLIEAGLVFALLWGEEDLALEASFAFSSLGWVRMGTGWFWLGLPVRAQWFCYFCSQVELNCLIINVLTFSLPPKWVNDFAQLPKFATLNSFRFGIVQIVCSVDCFSSGSLGRWQSKAAIQCSEHKKAISTLNSNYIKIPQPRSSGGVL